MRSWKYYNIPLSGRRAVVVGRSLVVGKPAAMMLDRENATVTICNSRTRDLPALCREADVVVVAMGKMGAVGADCLREGQTVVDVGIHVNEEGKLCGDVKFVEAEPVVDAITPVPGGVGTVTTSVLVGHVVQAAAKKGRSVSGRIIYNIASKPDPTSSVGLACLLFCERVCCRRRHLPRRLSSLKRGSEKSADFSEPQNNK